MLFMPKTKEHKPYRYFKKPGRKPINYFGKKYDDCLADMERNNWMTAEEAKSYGIIDKIIK